MNAPFLRAALAVGASVIVVLAAAAQQPKPPLIRHSFEEGQAGWTTFPENAGKISITGDASNVKEGKAALRFDYTLEKGKFTALALPMMGDLARMKSIRFWVKADAQTALIAAIQEEEGGRYAAGFSVPAGAWQRIELEPADFLLQESKDDPKDPNGRLDLDRSQAFVLTDLGHLFIQAGEPIIERVFGIKPGPRHFVLDEFVVSDEPLAAAPAAEPGSVILDAFVHPQTGWLAVFGARAQVVDAKPLSSRGLELAYRQIPDGFPGAIRSLRKGLLGGMSKLQMNVASVRASQLVVQLEEAGGGKYNAIVPVEGGSASRLVEVPFANMNPAEDSKDTNGKLDPEQVTQLVILDVAGVMNQADQENTLWIGSPRAVK